MTENRKNTENRIAEDVFKAAIATAAGMPADMDEREAARDLTKAAKIPFGAALGAVRAARRNAKRNAAFDGAKAAVAKALAEGVTGIEELRRVALVGAGNDVVLLSTAALEAAVGKARAVHEREERIAAATERFLKEKAKVAANNGVGARYKTGKTARKRARVA